MRRPISALFGYGQLWSLILFVSALLPQLHFTGQGFPARTPATSLVDADEGKTIKVKVTFADDAGDEETLTSAATATVAARPNTPMTPAQDDTTAPTISSVNITSDPDADIRTHGPYERPSTNGTGYHFQRGWYRIGDHITATVTFTETITVTGTPELRINVGASSKIASFENANGTTAAFTYTVTEGDSDSDGISISPNRLTLSGGTIKGDANNDAVLSYSAVSTLTAHKVDGIRPTLRDFSVLSLWRQGSHDDVFDIGDEIFAHARFSEPVFGSIAGPPTINLQIGDEFRPAEWEATAIPQYPTLFNYFIEEGDWESDGVSILANSINLNGGYIKDGAGNDAILTHTPATSDWRVDGIRAFVTAIAITSDPGTDNTYGEGDNIEITVTFSELVYATEYNQIEVDIGGTARKADGPLPSLTSSRDVVFTYTVQSRDDDNDGISIRANAITHPATDFGIKDALSDWPGGNMAYLEHASLTADPAHKVGNTGDDTSPNPNPTDPPIPPPTNHEPTGKPVIAGIAQEKQTLTAQVSGIADQNGLTNTTFTYQWIRVQNNADTNISNATGSTYTLTSEDVGNRIKVKVSFTDDQDYYEAVTSDPTATVADAPNSPATGPPIISGKVEVDKTLAAVTSRISDDDGLTQVVYAYQWIRGDGNTDTDIQGANTASYTLTDADQGKYIKVRVTFTDDNQNPEQLTSRQTTAVTAPLTLLKALTISPGTLTPAFENSTGTYNVPDMSNIDERITIVTRTAAGSTPTFVKAQVAFRVCSSTGTSCPWTYYDEDNNVVPPLTDADNDLDGFQVDLDVGNNKLMIQVNSTDHKEYESYRFTITRAEETQESQPPEPADKPTGLTGTVSHDAVSLTWDDPADESITGYQILRRNKALHQTGEFLVHLDNTGNTDTTYVDENVEPETRYVYRIKARNDDGLSQRSKKFNANTPAIPHNTNSAATGTPAVNGTAQVGETLTADTSDIADADGIANVSYHYQWIANDGNSDTDIAGETGINYTLVDTDEGQTIKVQVFFTDDADNDESLTSQATARVAAAAPTKPPGIPRNLTGTANSDGTVTLSWDAPNNHSVTGYQILRRSPTLGEKKLLVYVNDTGSAATEYTDSNVVPNELYAYRIKAINAVGLSRQSQFISVTPTQPAEPAQNSPATGTPTISGTLQVGETLTADTSGIADADGLTNVTFRYQWIPDDGSFDADNQDPPGSSYTLFEADEGKIIKLEVSFTDDAGNGESLTSAATAAVAARPNTPATGAPTISGTSQVTETLTANTSDIVDDDGLTNVAYSYQWITNDGSSDTDIAGETGITYTLVDTDEGKTIKYRLHSPTTRTTTRVSPAKQLPE